MIKIVEKKVSSNKDKLKHLQLMDDEVTVIPTDLVRRAKMVVKQLEQNQIYKRKQIKTKDAIKIAQMEIIPQAFYLYKQRNDLLLDRLKMKEKEKLFVSDKYNDRIVA
jgi:hypothetical protein